MPFTAASRPLTPRDLEAAIANVTRALAVASGEAVVVLASERAAMRAELLELRSAANVVPLPTRTA
jgi:hypothetical protein